MNLIRTRLHGFIDYGLGLFLLLPWTTGYFTGSQDTWLLGLAGLLIIFYSLLTDYEMGLLKFIPVKANLVLDVLVAVALALSPFFITIPHYYFYWPVGIGSCLFLTAVLSSGKPYQLRKRDTNITQPL